MSGTLSIREQLEFNRKNIQVKRDIVEVKFFDTIQVAKNGSSEFLENLSIVESEGIVYAVQHNGVYPKDETITLDFTKFKSKALTKEQASIILLSIGEYRAYWDYHLNPYTFIVTSCLLKGLDLIQEGILEL